MDALAQNLVSALISGAIYGVAGLGFTVVYNATKIMNFAQGEFLMMGALISAFFVTSFGLHIVLAIGIATIATVMLGVILDRWVIQLGRRKTPLNAVMITLGAAITFRGLAVVVIGRDVLFEPPFGGIPTITFGNVYLSSQGVWILLMLIVFSLGLSYMFSKTRIGMSMRAASDNPRAAMLCGIDSRWTSTLAFGIAAATGAIAGAFVAPISSAFYESGLFFSLKGFASAMLGGLGNPVGAIIGGMLIGLIETFSAGYLTSVYKDAVALTVLILVLLAMPDGLFGRAQVKRV